MKNCYLEFPIQNELLYKKERLKSCIFNFLFSIIRFYNKDITPLLFNDLYYYICDNKTGELYLCSKMFYTWETIVAQMGIGVESYVICPKLTDWLVECLECGSPVILGMDPYYLRFYKHIMQQKHAPHYILITGYLNYGSDFRIYSAQSNAANQYSSYTISADELKKSYEGNLFNYYNVYRHRDGCDSPTAYKFSNKTSKSILPVDISLFRINMKKYLYYMESSVESIQKHLEYMYNGNFKWQTDKLIELANSNIAVCKLLQFMFTQCIGQDEVVNLAYKKENEWNKIRYFMIRNQMRKSDLIDKSLISKQFKNLYEIEKQILQKINFWANSN